MVWFTRKPPGGIEIPRLILAAHEIGHYLAFGAAEVPVAECKIVGEGDDIRGFNLVADPAAGQHHGYLVALMAGIAGERYWCEIYGQKLPQYCRDGTSMKGDRKEFKAVMREAGFRLSERRAINMAHTILRDNAKRFRVLTEQLAVDGALRL